MSHLDYFYRLFPIRLTSGFCYSYTKARRFIMMRNFQCIFRNEYRHAILYCKTPSHTKYVGENKTVLQLKKFAEVLLIGLTYKKMRQP